MIMLLDNAVAPFAGARIEMMQETDRTGLSESLHLRAGAWIEMLAVFFIPKKEDVAPLAGGRLNSDNYQE